MPESRKIPIVTYAAAAAAAAIHVLRLALPAAPEDPENFHRFGFRSAHEIWDGDVWALWTSTFLHGDLIHLAFNLYWLWILGRAIETTIGAVRYALFFAVAAALSASYQLAVSDDPGIGLSGVGYALFGFGWIARSRFAELRTVVDQQVVGLFLGWMVLCLALTRMGAWNIANTAHAAGLVFGALVGAATLPRWRWAGIAGAAAFSIFGVVALVWAPWSPVWNALQGERAQERGDEAAATAYYERAAGIDPGDAWLHGELGDRCMRRNDYEAAIGHFDRAIEADPKYAWALAQRGVARRRLGDAAAGAADLRDALKLEPDDAYAREQLAWCDWDRGEFAAAAEEFTRAIALDPDAAWSHAGRGSSYRWLDRLDEGERDLTRALELDPEFAWAHEERGWCRIHARRAEDALDDFDRARELGADSADLHRGRGLALLRLERWEDSLRALRIAIQLTGDGEGDADLGCLAAIDLWHMGRKDDARAFLKKARALAQAEGEPSSFEEEAGALID